MALWVESTMAEQHHNTGHFIRILPPADIFSKAKEGSLVSEPQMAQQHPICFSSSDMDPLLL